MSHHCQALVISCMDWRLHKSLHEWAEAQYPEGYDLVHLAGGAGALLQADTTATVLKQVELSQKLHSTTEVVLVNHQDCGAYGGSASFNNDLASEFARYDADLTAAAALIAKQFPELKVIRAIEQLDGTVVTRS